MKKIIMLVFAVILSNCEIEVKPREISAQSYYTKVYSYKEEEHRGMTYGIYYVIDRAYETGYCITIVNLTKDALEVELLKKQLKEYENKKH